MRTLLHATGVAVAMALLIGCTAEPSEHASATAAVPTTSEPAGTQAEPYSLGCPSGNADQKVLRDGWYDVATMTQSCVGFRLRSRRSGGCIFSMPSQQTDKEAIQQVIHSWTKRITSKNLGSVVFWGTIPVKFENCGFQHDARKAENEPAGTQDKPHDLGCPSAARRQLQDAWYDTATMDERCVGFRLTSRNSGDCVFAVSGSSRFFGMTVG